MKSYESEAQIAASPEAVWPVLVDVGAWPSWDSGVTAVEGGPAAQGAKLKITSAANPGRAFPVTVTELDPHRRVVFAGGMPLGLFRGVRTYTLEPTAEGGTHFRMREQYSGPLAGLIGRSIPDLGPSFQQFADGLKGRAEAG
jgi:hypothetical protein